MLTSPISPETYTVLLPIDDRMVAIDFDALGGESIEEVAEGLEAALLDEQTAYSVAIDDSGFSLYLVHQKLGLAFVPIVSDNLVHEIVEDAVAAPTTPDGTAEGRLLVLAAENAVGSLMREFYTLDENREILARNYLLVREQHTGRVFDVAAEDVLTVLSRATPV